MQRNEEIGESSVNVLEIKGQPFTPRSRKITFYRPRYERRQWETRTMKRRVKKNRRGDWKCYRDIGDELIAFGYFNVGKVGKEGIYDEKYLFKPPLVKKSKTKYIRNTQQLVPSTFHR